ncbi:hypothetical protein [Bradyrhizobium sp. AUGA SZCCT0160]|uniref:hypothetical protein n=1 Tax=Bradyrhizobium sp. AUGA SZCCT0160 TaxID=2807662 RepID=UPI001BAAA246|nr:hypothetical protein [Bradyrhizobium sp. AUGA SZCCT0160]MBR1187972.1 hypothetical protein [Bradyrhizobium sp. AUGA SZCCT0160]MBR1188293.1 hypothetical protein [Bradyrhizobium sp. AUGA SZCCT0160]
MNAVRRGLLGMIGVLLMASPSDAGGQKPAASGQDAAAKARRASVKPRHVLCFLGGKQGLAKLSDAASMAIRDFATGFGIDQTYSQDKPDPRMSRSFGVSWDRVHPNARSSADDDAVENHQSVLYVLGPPMTTETAIVVSTGALMLVHQVIKAGATAVKGESAGVAHGLVRWNELILQASAALKSDDDFALRRVCRLAFAKRPLASDDYLESVGFHLAGLPEVFVPKSHGSERQAVATMDAVADEIARQGLEATLKSRRAKLSFESDYAEGDFKFNPYGIVKLAS